MLLAWRRLTADSELPVLDNSKRSAARCSSKPPPFLDLHASASPNGPERRQIALGKGTTEILIRLSLEPGLYRLEGPG